MTDDDRIKLEPSWKTRIADWLKNRDFPRHLPVPMALNALYVHIVFLLHQGEVARFLGTLEALPPEVVGKSAYGAFSLSFLLAAGYALAQRRQDQFAPAA